jgi:hypothetical protein
LVFFIIINKGLVHGIKKLAPFFVIKICHDTGVFVLK